MCPNIKIQTIAIGPRIGIPPAIPAIVFTTVAITLVASQRAKRREYDKISAKSCIIPYTS